jgi:hypothetical protein
MSRCEDHPCCGHEDGCCPDFDEAGNQLNMKCVCGATVPLNNHVSLCDACLRAGDEEEHDLRAGDEEGYVEPDHGDLVEQEEFERADEYYGREDFGDYWGDE